MKRTRRVVVAAVLVLWFPAPGTAQDADPMVTDRPDFTESASTVTPGRFQFELGYTFTKAGSEERHSFGELLARAHGGGILFSTVGTRYLKGPGHHAQVGGGASPAPSSPA